MTYDISKDGHFRITCLQCGGHVDVHEPDDDFFWALTAMDNVESESGGGSSGGYGTWYWACPVCKNSMALHRHDW